MRAAVPLLLFATSLAAWSPSRADAAPGATSAAAEASAPIRVVLVRHSEAAPDGTSDPGLSERGRTRAACVADALAPLEPTLLVTSPFRRSRETLVPLAQRLEVESQPRDPMAARALADELGALPAGSVVVVNGHSNTLPLLASAFGVEMSGLVMEQGQPALPRDEHDRLIEIRVRAGAGPASDRVIDHDERRLGCDPKARE